MRYTVYVEDFVKDPSQVQRVQRNTYKTRLWNYKYRRPVRPAARRIDMKACEQAGRQTDIHRDRQKGGQTDRQTETGGYRSQAGILNVKN